MGFDVRMLDATSTAGGAITSDRRLCVAADGATVVEEDDPRAAALLCPAGGDIPADRAKALRLAVVDGKVVQQAAEPPAAKERAPSEDKQAEKPADKARAPQAKK